MGAQWIRAEASRGLWQWRPALLLMAALLSAGQGASLSRVARGAIASRAENPSGEFLSRQRPRHAWRAAEAKIALPPALNLAFLPAALEAALGPDMTESQEAQTETQRHREEKQPGHKENRGGPVRGGGRAAAEVPAIPVPVVAPAACVAAFLLLRALATLLLCRRSTEDGSLGEPLLWEYCRLTD